mgnify:CR=1 FL=1
MKRITAYVLALVLTCFCVSSVAGAYYADVPGSSALAGEVEKAVRYGLMNGYSQAQFGYSDTMTRAQAAAVKLTRILRRRWLCRRSFLRSTVMRSPVRQPMM